MSSIFSILGFPSLEDAKRIFEKWDSDRSGTMTLRELSEAIRREKPIFSKVDMLKFMRTIDADNSGQVTLEEFIQRAHKEKRLVERLFDDLDLDSDGLISLSEFERLCELTRHKICVDMESLFKRLDLDGSGELDLKEFMQAFVSGGLDIRLAKIAASKRKRSTVPLFVPGLPIADSNPQKAWGLQNTIALPPAAKPPLPPSIRPGPYCYCEPPKPAHYYTPHPEYKVLRGMGAQNFTPRRVENPTRFVPFYRPDTW